MTRVRVELPAHLRTLARVTGEVELEVLEGTLGGVLDALERRFPTLGGTVRDPLTGLRRPLLRFFVCQEDWSHLGWDVELPESVLSGREAVLVVGAISGG